MTPSGLLLLWISAKNVSNVRGLAASLLPILHVSSHCPLPTPGSFDSNHDQSKMSELAFRSQVIPVPSFRMSHTQRYRVGYLQASRFPPMRLYKRFPLGLPSKFRFEKFHVIDLETVFVIPRKKVLLPWNSVSLGIAHSKIWKGRSGTEWGLTGKFSFA